MKKITFLVIIFLFTSVSFGKSKVCLTLTNFNQHDVILTSMGGPGYPYIAQPFQTIILPEDEMDWACPNDNHCSVVIRDNKDLTNIRHLRNGARITYFEKDKYFIDPDANTPCPEQNNS
jgi:hypothetical protein